MTEAALSSVPQPLAPSSAPGRLFAFVRRLVREKPLGAAGGAIFLVFLFCGIFADFLAPYGMNETNLEVRLEAPSLAHPLGTDHLGRDLLSRLIHAVRFSLLIALAGTAIGAFLGTLLGFLAAHFRGLVDDLIMLLVDFQAAIPFIILALAAIAFLGNNLFLFICILGIQGWERYARIARGLALSAKERGYVVALKTAGASPWRIYARHVLPNVAGALIVQMTLNFPETVLWESALSFLGLGVQPPNTSLGALLGFGRDYLFNAWWLALFPGGLIVLTTLAMSISGDWLRDKLDPRLKKAK